MNKNQEETEERDQKVPLCISELKTEQNNIRRQPRTGPLPQHSVRHQRRRAWQRNQDRPRALPREPVDQQAQPEVWFLGVRV